MAGVTTVTNTYYHADEIAKSVAEVGIRGVIGQTVMNFPVVDAPKHMARGEIAIPEINHDFQPPVVDETRLDNELLPGLCDPYGGTPDAPDFKYSNDVWAMSKRQ